MRKITASRPVSLSIGELSRLTGVNIETIRYYERIGVMPVPPRTEGGQRIYGEDHLKRLAFVRRSRELGFSLDEVRALLGLVGSHALTCADVRNMALGHIVDIRQKVKDLKKLERVLTDLADRCHGRKVPECPLLDTLNA
jgi:MerR family transcriptional regulator, mercuric resistance operon regulatory protein